MKMTLKEWLARNGYASAEEALAEYRELDDTYPAICSEDCEVEPDGHCAHGAPSLLLAMDTSDMETPMSSPKFPLGHLVATPGALSALADAGNSPQEFLDRHVRGDWGELSEEDRKENDLSLAEGLRILSAYILRDGTKIWIITEADRSSTCILLPEEY